MYRFITICLSALFLTATAVAQHNSQQQIDSLRSIIKTQSGIEKVETYQLIMVNLFYNINLPSIN